MSSRESLKQTSLGGQLDTHGVHLQKKVVKNVSLLNIIKSDTHGVHLQKKVIKNVSLLKIIK
jgi:hypothetical protein